jgi:hypothetical protein
VWLAIAIGFDLGPGVENLTKIQKIKPLRRMLAWCPIRDHCMKAGHVRFTVINGEVQRKVTDGEDFR